MNNSTERSALIAAYMARLGELNREIHSNGVIDVPGKFEDLSIQQKATVVAVHAARATLVDARLSIQMKIVRLIEDRDRNTESQAHDLQILKAAHPVRIMHPPGARLGHVLGFLLTRRAFDKLVAPVIADAQHEYVEAVAAGHDRHARWIAIRLHFIVWYGWVYGLFASVVRRIKGAGTGG